MDEKQVKHLIQRLKDSIEFSFNGDLGVLQHVTRENKKQVLIYLACGLITEQEAEEIVNDIMKYYHDELQKEIKRGYIF